MPRASSKAAYTLVDLSELDPEVRREILEDAEGGGGVYGIRVVDEHKWEAAKEEFGITSTVVTEEDEAALREAAVAQTDEQAEAIREKEEAAVRAVTKEDASSSDTKANRA